MSNHSLPRLLATLCALACGGCDASHAENPEASAGSGTGGVSGAGAGSSGGGRANGGSGGGEGGGDGTSLCAGSSGGPTLQRTFSPDLFSQGADPSGAPECTEILNPERGVFLYRDLRSLGSLTALRDQGYTLIYGRILIDDYLDTDIDAALMNELKGAFASARSAGIKVLPRAYYANDGTAPDAPLNRVLAHIEQLGPVWRDNSDVIAAVHAGFVGAWGEWHASTNDLTAPENRLQIFDALLEEIPGDRFILARRPSHKQAAYGGPLTTETAFAGTPLARIGHLNDCFLASANDMGTYQLEGEEDYAIQDSAFAAVGGETCAVNPPRSECASALLELARHHWSFVNTSYHPDVIVSWQSAGCFDQIRCRLGYRFMLLGYESPQTLRVGDTFELKLRLFNDGFARAYNPRPLHLVLRGPTEHITLTDVDIRSVAPNETAELCLAAELPADLPPGSYQVALWMPDPAATLEADARFAVRLSNGVTWEPSTGLNVLDVEVSVVP